MFGLKGYRRHVVFIQNHHSPIESTKTRVGQQGWPPELEFLNKMPNPGILESRDLRLGRIQRFFFAQLFFKKIAFSHYCKCYVYCLGSLDVSSPDWRSLGLSSILNLNTIIKYKLFNFIVYQFTIPYLKKHDVVRPKNRFGKPNPGISAPMKCFWIPTLVSGNGLNWTFGSYWLYDNNMSAFFLG